MTDETSRIAPPASDEPNFDVTLERLEDCVERLETEQLSLEDALAVFEAGISASRDCAKLLDQTRKRVQVLVEKTGGEFQLEFLKPLNADEEEAGDDDSGLGSEDGV